MQQTHKDNYPATLPKFQMKWSSWGFMIGLSDGWSCNMIDKMELFTDTWSPSLAASDFNAARATNHSWGMTWASSHTLRFTTPSLQHNYRKRYALDP